MNKANIRLMGMLRPKIKLNIRNRFDVYQWVLIIPLILFVSCQALAQEVTVQNVPPAAKVQSEEVAKQLEGIIKSASTGLPIEGARIKVKGSSIYSYSDQSGDFSIQTDQEIGTVEVSVYGYESMVRDFKDGALKRGATVFFLHADVANVPPIVIGDSIPDSLWDLPLTVVNHPTGRNVITLREYQHEKLLILDFWATWCSPCIESMNKWEGYVKETDGDVVLIGFFLDFSNRALPFIERRNWKSVNVINNEVRSVNRFFFTQNAISRMAWIKNGKLLTISSRRDYDLDLVKKVIKNQEVTLPLDTSGIHSYSF